MPNIELIGSNREEYVKSNNHAKQKSLDEIIKAFVGVEGFEPPTLCL
jgi:hypothetical protein